MSGGEEVIGDIATGALAARAIEPGHGEPADDGHTHERACLNCGTALVGNHCHQCGQAAHVHRTLAAFFHDLLHAVLHFEGKLWRTLPLLARRPGKLTREYIDGRRASYVSPIALFLFTVFITFALFNAIGDPVNFKINQAGVAEARADAVAEVARLEREIARKRAAGDPLNGLEGQLDGARTGLEQLDKVARGELPDRIARPDPTSANEQAAANRINAAWQRVRENPELVIYKSQQNAYKFSWLLIPLSVPFVWLLFPFSRRFHLYDHTVFVTYSQAFMLILLAAASALAVWGQADWLIGVLILYAPFHLYRQLRETYGLTRLGAWWRTWLLSAFAFTALALFVAAIAVMAMD